MRIFVARETARGETRIAMVPKAASKLTRLEAELEVEAGLGEALGIADGEYAKTGAKIVTDRRAAFGSADMVLRLRPPEPAEVQLLRRGAIQISYMDPFHNHALVQASAEAGISAISMEMIPRSTIAQKMDALSSQANIGGYVAVILAAERLNRIFPMMMTPSGTINPAKVFIIGAGVAGLQAIATAKRLGARVEAFDTRPAVEEQVQSLGARFVKVPLGETGETKGGYAKELTAEQLEKQRQAMAKHCADADVVITTAQVFGKKAPLIVTEDMLAGMKPGSVIVDMAVETGGNVATSKLDQEVLLNSVRIIGLGNLAGRAPVSASEMYANNLVNFVDHFWDKAAKQFILRLDNELIKGSLITQGGRVVHEAIAGLLG